MDPAIQELLDKKACEEVLMRYSRTLDWLDYPGRSTCFWPDADIDYGFLKSDAAGWLDKLKDIESGAARRWHMTANSLIKIDGANAFAESYTLAVGTGEENGQLINTLFGGRFLDDFEKRGGRVANQEARLLLRLELSGTRSKSCAYQRRKSAEHAGRCSAWPCQLPAHVTLDS